MRITANNLEYQTSEFRKRMKRFGIYGNFLQRRLCHSDTCTFTGFNLQAWDYSIELIRLKVVRQIKHIAAVEIHR